MLLTCLGFDVVLIFVRVARETHEKGELSAAETCSLRHGLSVSWCSLQPWSHSTTSLRPVVISIFRRMHGLMDHQPLRSEVQWGMPTAPILFCDSLDFRPGPALSFDSPTALRKKCWATGLRKAFSFEPETCS